jgi:hypothetical protein
LKLGDGIRTCSIKEYPDLSGSPVPNTKKIPSLTSLDDVIECYRVFGSYNLGNPLESKIRFEDIAKRYAGLEISFECNYLDPIPGADFERPENMDIKNSDRWTFPILTLFDVCSGCIWDISVLCGELPEPEPIYRSALVRIFGPDAGAARVAEGVDASSRASALGKSRGTGGGPSASFVAGAVMSILVLMTSSLAGASRRGGGLMV